jgi:hypothetical protein
VTPDTKSTVEQLLSLLKDKSFAEVQEAKALLAEVEKLISGEKQ